MTNRVGEIKSSLWIIAAISIILLAGLSVMAHSSWTTTSPLSEGDKRPALAMMMQSEDADAEEEIFRVAFLGNSILYFNDCPRLVEQMLLAANKKTNHLCSSKASKKHHADICAAAASSSSAIPRQDSCLRGGASLVSLWERGNGMKGMFATPPAKRDDGTYDVGAHTIPALFAVGSATNKAAAAESSNLYWNAVVLNDHTQSPARHTTRQLALEALREHYIPLFLKVQERQQLLQQPNLTVVFLQTAAYQKTKIMRSDDLGNFDEFTDKIAEGYQEYVQVVQSYNLESKLAPVGEAYRQVRQTNRPLWNKLYSWDHFHPSPHGTWLEACVLYCTLTNTAPPTYQSAWWNQARCMQPPEQEPLPRPTLEEAEELRLVACGVCGVASI